MNAQLARCRPPIKYLLQRKYSEQRVLYRVEFRADSHCENGKVLVSYHG